MQVTVPPGVGPGEALQVSTPAGIMQVTVPDGCGPGAAFEMLVPAAAATAPPPPQPPPLPPVEAEYSTTSLPLMSTPPPADAAPMAARGAAPPPAADFDDEPLPALEPLQLDLDESKQALPSFEQYKRGPPKPMPAAGSTYASKLPSINQGKSIYDQLPEKDEKTPFEKFIFRSTWAGIALLIGVEIFINTPLFQEVKPVILRFLADDANIVQ